MWLVVELGEEVGLQQKTILNWPGCTSSNLAPACAVMGEDPARGKISNLCLHEARLVARADLRLRVVLDGTAVYLVG